MTRLDLRRAMALGVLIAAAGCTPRGPEALRRGDEALAAGRTAEAIPLLERAVTDLPADAVAWNHLGLAYQADGRTTEAQKAYLRALQFDRNFFDVHFNLGALEFEQGRWIEAERALRTYLGVERNRTNAAAWRLLGDALLASRQFDFAERTLATAAQLAPQDAGVRNSLGLTFAQRRRWREAQAQFAQAIRLAPDDPAARLNLAVALQQLGDRRGAIEHYRTYLGLLPTPANADAVRALVQQLEASLAPVVTVTTNHVTTATNLVRTVTNSPRAATNTVATVPTRPPAVVPVKTNTLPSRVVTVPPPTNPPTPVPAPAPAVRPTAPVEVVRVEESPELKPARDVAAPPTTSPTATPPAPTPPPQMPTVVADSPVTAPTPPPSASLTSNPTNAPHKSFWQKVSPVNWGNPVKWFRGSGGNSETNAPAVNLAAAPPPSPTLTLPAPSSGATPPTASATPAPVEAPRRSPPPKPVIARYPRASPLTLTAGNRSAAEAQAQLAAAAPDRATALAGYQRAVQLDPSWAAAWFQAGRLALETGNLSSALRAGEAVVTLEPDAAPSQQLFAAALARGGYPADAAEHLERAVALAPGNASAHLALAGLYARDLAEPALARPHYERVLALDPQNSQAAAIRLWLANNP